MHWSGNNGLTSYFDSISFDIENEAICTAEPTADRGSIPSEPRHKPRTPCSRYVLMRAFIMPVCACWKPTAYLLFAWACNCVFTIYSGQPTAEPITPHTPPQKTHNTIECDDDELKRVHCNWSTVSYKPSLVLFITNWKESAGTKPKFKYSKLHAKI